MPDEKPVALSPEQRLADLIVDFIWTTVRQNEEAIARLTSESMRIIPPEKADFNELRRCMYDKIETLSEATEDQKGALREAANAQMSFALKILGRVQE